MVEYIRGQPQMNRIRLLCEIADAVSYLHKNDIVHGDIKGSNVLADDAIHCLLCDFGPELWTGGAKSFSSDTYAFAMTIVVVHTGEVPFSHIENDTVVVLTVLHNDERPQKLPESLFGASYKSTREVADACWPQKQASDCPPEEAPKADGAEPSGHAYRARALPHHPTPATVSELRGRLGGYFQPNITAASPTKTFYTDASEFEYVFDKPGFAVLVSRPFESTTTPTSTSDPKLGPKHPNLAKEPPRITWALVLDGRPEGWAAIDGGSGKREKWSSPVEISSNEGGGTSRQGGQQQRGWQEQLSRVGGGLSFGRDRGQREGREEQVEQDEV
ncbi:hypothetical protein M407DRAFT_19299 [Tulasnella calospora MUT 4182]|uniref:Protein kinase domain-containing protein n=1 Tax=Tulasnella calospora MUT 4182 TaxID=1051891 RepID=A0A0C3QSA1_9AGAM|nr:hypothetical protein M407DRAFT_19299 [Tulasnella calospora MUT 4182]